MMSPCCPAVEQIHEMLRRHQALVVHFSGTPKGSGSDYRHLYPGDLRHVIADAGQGGLSCSTVMPQDEFEDPSRANATGCVGVILGFTSGQSILDAHPRDCGSYVEDDIRIIPNTRDLSIDDLELTIVQRPADAYNEWVIAGYEVQGVFAASPYAIWAESMPAEPPDLPDYLRATSPVGDIAFTCPASIALQFANLPLFSFSEGRLAKWENGSWTAAEHPEAYKPISTV